MKIDPYIVELEEGVWMAEGDGDPARTLRRKHARIFKSKNMARLGLNLARHYRPFKQARIVPAYREGTRKGPDDAG